MHTNNLSQEELWGESDHVPVDPTEVTVRTDVVTYGFTTPLPVYRTFWDPTEDEVREFMADPFGGVDEITVYTGRQTYVDMYVYRGEDFRHLDGILLALRQTEGVRSITVDKWRFEH